LGESVSYLDFSEKDAIRARQMFDLKDYTVCGWFCEQSMEKSLKAFLGKKGTLADKPLMTLHKPKRLYERCCELGLEDFDKQFALELAIFTDYYYDTNYPSASYIELTEAEAKEALEIMEKINRLVKSRI
jgi:HEPN domain-containing protein